MATNWRQSVVNGEGEVFKVKSDDVSYTPEAIFSRYSYSVNECKINNGFVEVEPKQTEFVFKTERATPKLGVMLVGLGGNNGSTAMASIIANRKKMSWETKEGMQEANYFGSITQSSTVRLGTTADGEQIYVPMNKMVPICSPNDLVIGGWDINKLNLYQAMKRAGVLPVTLQQQLKADMEKVVPLPGLYYPDFIASNQEDRADHTIKGSKPCMEHVETIRKNIRDFKAANGLDKVIILWTANTERFAEISKGVNTTSAELMDSIRKGHPEVSASTVYAVAAALEGCSYINGSPQNTFVPGFRQLAQEKGIFIGGDDFKSGQTKMKSVLVDFLVNAGLKVESIVSYNHLGNNDGKNLNEAKQFRSKEISKSNVVDDMVAANPVLYPDLKTDHPDHCVVIKYVPFVGDSKRAMDEYTSRIFMNGLNTIAMHNVCEDSLLATPLIIDLVLLTELCERITYKIPNQQVGWSKFNHVLSILSYLLKAPVVEDGAPVVNALAAQRSCIENVMKALVGLPPDNSMLLEHKTALSVEKMSPVASAPGISNKLYKELGIKRKLNTANLDVPAGKKQKVKA